MIGEDKDKELGLLMRRGYRFTFELITLMKTDI